MSNHTITLPLFHYILIDKCSSSYVNIPSLMLKSNPFIGSLPLGGSAEMFQSSFAFTFQQNESLLSRFSQENPCIK